MSELLEAINSESFTFNYDGYEGSFLPYETLQVLMEDDPEMSDWDVYEIVKRVDRQLKKYAYCDEKGFRLDKHTRRIQVKGSSRILRPLYYFLMTGTYPKGRYVLRAPDDNPSTLDLNQLELFDRRKATLEAYSNYREHLRKVKELTGGANE